MLKGIGTPQKHSYKMVGWMMGLPKDRSKLPEKVKESVFKFLKKKNKIDSSVSLDYFLDNFEEFNYTRYWFESDIFNEYGLRNRLMWYNDRIWFDAIVLKNSDFYGNIKDQSKEKTDNIVYEKLIEMGFSKDDFKYYECGFD